MRNINVIVISDDIQTLTGVGTEYLADKNGEVIALFIDGNFERPVMLGDGTEITAKAA